MQRISGNVSKWAREGGIQLFNLEEGYGSGRRPENIDIRGQEKTHFFSGRHFHLSVAFMDAKNGFLTKFCIDIVIRFFFSTFFSSIFFFQKSLAKKYFPSEIFIKEKYFLLKEFLKIFEKIVFHFQKYFFR